MHRQQLNNRQERFVHEFLKDQNASAAAVRAGYSGRSKGAQANNLMNHPLVRERISLALGDMYAALDITAVNLLREESRIAFFDPRKLYKGGKPVPLEELDDDCAAAIGVAYSERADGAVTKRVRQLSKLHALGALERRYEKFLELQMALLERERGGEGAEPPPGGPGGSAPGRDCERERESGRAPVLDLMRMEAGARPGAQAEAGSGVGGVSPGVPETGVKAAPGLMSGEGVVAARQAALARMAEEVRAVDAVDVAAVTGPAEGLQPADMPLGAAPSAEVQASAAQPVPAQPAPPKYKVSAFRQAMDEAEAESHAKAVREALEAGLPPPAPKGPPDPDAPYDFRKDPNWMWGGRVKPVPPPEKGWVELEAEANAQWRKQNAELFANHKHLRVRPGAAIMPARMEPGYNPPWLRRDRPAVGDPGPVFRDDEDD